MITDSPLRPNVKPKRDVLNWERLPPGECALNFRPPTQHALDQGERVVGLLLQVALIAAGMTVVVPLIPALLGLHSSTLTSAIAAGVVLALLASVGGLVPSGLAISRVEAICWGLFSVPLLWLFIRLLALTSSPWVALALVVTVGFGWVVSLADQIATHFLYWQSANPQIDHATMQSWRAGWEKRFEELPPHTPRRTELSDSEQQRVKVVEQLRQAYSLGFLGLAGCYLLAPVMFFFSGSTGRSGFWGAAILLLALVAFTGYRLIQVPCSWSLFWQALSSWTYYGAGARWPMLVFQSPAGFQLNRQLLLMGGVALLTILMLPLLLSAPWLAIVPSQPGSALTGLGLPLLLMLLAAVLFPLALLTLSIYVLIAPAITAHHLALDADDAYEQQQQWRELDGYADRLQHSPHPVEQNSLICGYNPSCEYPYLLDLDLLFEHMHMLGATGIGKTALGLLTLVTQLIRRNDGPVIVIDAKGDRALFNSVRIEAQRVGRTFKWFTNKPQHSTYVFNPFGQRSLQQLTLPEVLGIITQSLNLYHGEDYGRAWFSIAARVLLRAALLTTMPDHPAQQRQPAGRRHRRRRTSPPVESFRDLEVLIREVATDDEEYKAARHLMFLVQSLCDFEQLNLAPRQHPRSAAVAQAIHMPDVISNKEVIYFYLTGMADLASVAQIARLVMYATLTAAMAHRDSTGQKPKIYFLCDEAQVLVGRNIENVLAQAREYGMACLLAHQTMSQLNPPGGVDLRELVTSCTTVKQFFSARDPQTQKFLSEISGSVPYVNLKWQQLKRRVVTHNEFGPQYAASDQDGEMLIAVEEKIGQRLMPEDIQDINRDPNQSIFLVERSQGFSQFQGAFPMHTTWPMSKDEHARRSFEIPWPEPQEATLTVLPDWPQPTAETLIAQPQPTTVEPVSDAELQQQLEAIREQLANQERGATS